MLLSLDALLAAPRPLPLQVSLGEEEVSVELRLETAGYPRQAVAALAQRVAQSGGRFHELWRLPKAERDAQRARMSAGRVQTFADAPQAARALAGHLSALASRPAPRAGPRAAAPEATVRRAPRFPTRLEVVFHTEFDFVLEHATNISNGGLYVRTALRPPVDSVVELEVRLPSGEVLRGQAVVRHVREGAEDGGVGLEFLHDDAAFAAALDRYLASLAGSGG